MTFTRVTIAITCPGRIKVCSEPVTARLLQTVSGLVQDLAQLKSFPLNVIMLMTFERQMDVQRKR